MIALLLSLAHADDRVQQITWAQRFELEVAHPYRHTANPREIREGWLVELRVDPRTQQPRQAGVPGLWIGDTLAVRTNWDHLGGCAVVWVPGPHDLAKEPVFFGSTTLPERVDAERAALDHAEAQQKGWGPVPVRELASEVLRATDLRQVMQVAADRVEGCSQSDEARLRALRAK